MYISLSNVVSVSDERFGLQIFPAMLKMRSTAAEDAGTHRYRRDNLASRGYVTLCWTQNCSGSHVLGRQGLAKYFMISSRAVSWVAGITASSSSMKSNKSDSMRWRFVGGSRLAGSWTTVTSPSGANFCAALVAIITIAAFSSLSLTQRSLKRGSRNAAILKTDSSLNGCRRSLAAVCRCCISPPLYVAVKVSTFRISPRMQGTTRLELMLSCFCAILVTSSNGTSMSHISCIMFRSYALGSRAGLSPSIRSRSLSGTANTERSMISCEFHLVSEAVCRRFCPSRTSAAMVDFRTKDTSLDALPKTRLSMAPDPLRPSFTTSWRTWAKHLWWPFRKSIDFLIHVVIFIVRGDFIIWSFIVILMIIFVLLKAG